MGETLSYEAGLNAGYLVGQVQGTMGPGVNAQGLGWKVERREFTLKAIVGFKISITPNK
ncbi:MAG TPA: hypothetical protein PK239_18665 [Chitinophagales bacterium]|nr:hypothetical protein [Chitinophagales bacterium]